MVYTIYSRRGNPIAVLRAWDGVVRDTRSESGHWTWAVGRKIETILSWAAGHFMRWEVTTDETARVNTVQEAEQV